MSERPHAQGARAQGARNGRCALALALITASTVSAAEESPTRARGSSITWARRDGRTKTGERPLVARAWEGALPSWARSVRVLAVDAPLFVTPSAKAARRGAAALGARLPLYAARNAEGCRGAWFQVGPEAWLCETDAEPSDAPPLGATETVTPPEDGLPHSYYFVGELGSFAYRELESAESGLPAAQLEPGFAVAVVRSKARDPNDVFGLTSHALWIPLRDVRAANPSGFAGAVPGAGRSLAWVRENGAALVDSPRGRTVERVPRRSPLVVRERLLERGKAWLRLEDGRFVEESKVLLQTPAPPPAGLESADERWIDVDLREQVLTAYEGSVPVFTTLVSSGRGAPGTEEATPLGEHRLWVKLVSSDMDNLENEEASRYYQMQSVPWVMYFEGGYGLHGVFWHDDFGKRRSHGCVNLSPRDASRLFQWTSPRLPAGWSAVLPTRYEPGTLVRIRDGSLPASPAR